MRFYELKDPSAVMPFTLWMLEIFGLYGSKPWIFARCVFKISWMSFVISVPKIFQGYRDDRDVIIRGFSELIFQGNMALKIVLFAWKRRGFEKILLLLQKWYHKTFEESRSSEASVMLLKSNKSIDFICKGYYSYVTGVLIVYSTGPVIQSLIAYYTHDSNSSEPMELKIHMEQEFYWLDIRTNLFHYAIYCACSILAYTYASQVVILNGVFMYCCTYCCSNLFKVVSLRLREMDKLRGGKQHEELKDIVEMHVDVLECVGMLEEMLNLPLMMQIINCMFMWCMMAIYLSNNIGSNAINVVAMFLVLTTETYTLCRLGKMLSDESNEIQKSAYNYPWYESPRYVQRTLLRVMQRAQKHVGLTAAGFFFVDIERFRTLTQTSYSIYLVMKDTL